MKTSIDEIDDLEFTFGHVNGRRVWFVSDGTVIPWVGGGAGDDDAGSDGDDQDDDDQDDDDDGGSDDDEQGDDGDGADDSSEVEKWKRLARRHEKRAKDNKAELDKLRREKMTPDEQALEDAKDAGRTEARKGFAERSVSLYLDAQVEAGRLTDDQADVLLDSIDPAKFLDDDGDVDTAKVKALIGGIAKPGKGTGEGTNQDLDTGQGRRNGSRRRAEKQSYAAGRDLWAERSEATK